MTNRYMPKGYGELAGGLEEAGILVQGDFVFASGIKATQKLDWDRIDPESDIFNECARLGSVAITDRYGDDSIIVPIPTGANEYAARVASFIGRQNNYTEIFDKNSETRELSVKKAMSDKVDLLKNVVLVDDIFTTGSSIGRAKNILGNSVAGALVVWDRSDESEHKRATFLQHSGVFVDALVHKYVSINY